MENVSMVYVSASLHSLELTVLRKDVQMTAMETDSVLMEHASAMLDFQDWIVIRETVY
jgi:hypothetical protein